MRPAEGGWRAEGQCGKMPRGCNWPRSSMSDARKAMHTHTSFEAENEASKRLSDAFRVADSTRSEEYHEQCPQRFTMSARREEVGTAKQNATSNTHNDSPCLRDKELICRIQLCQSNTHNDSPCLRDEEPICRIQFFQNNTHNDSPCLRDEKRWESAKERNTACAVVPDPCRFQRAPFLQETLSRQRWTYSHSPTRSAG